MSTYNRMPTPVRLFVVIIAVIALLSLIVYAGRIILDGTILHEEPQYAELVKTPEADEGLATSAEIEVAEAEMEEIIPDAAEGAKIAGKCKACHDFKQGGANKVGPALWGIVGNEIASHEGFSYSSAFEGKKGEVVWDEETLNTFLTKPRDFVKGTKMAFAGLRKEADRAHLIAYLKTLK